jgi:sulfur carrier protein ThiS
MIVKYFDEDDENIKSIYIPIRANNALSAAECTVTVHYDDRKIEIKQDTEIPILINAYDMGAKKIVVTNNFSGVQKIFTGNEQPITFLDE